METVKRTKIKALLASEPGAEVLAKGWVRTKRGNKQVKFIARALYRSCKRKGAEFEYRVINATGQSDLLRCANQLKTYIPY